MRQAVTIGALAALVIGATAAWQIQHEMREDEAGLLARAAVSPDDARATALAAVLGGRIVDSEIEEENGRLMYAFDVRAGGHTYDVEIDAMTGELLQNAIEDDDDDDDRDDDDADDTR